MPGGNPEATLYLSNLDDRVNETVLYDIMVQAGPVVDVYIPRDKETKRHRGYGFAEYASVESASYALKLYPGFVNLYNRPIHFALSGGDKRPQNSHQPEPTRTSRTEHTRGSRTDQIRTPASAHTSRPPNDRYGDQFRTPTNDHSRVSSDRYSDHLRIPSSDDRPNKFQRFLSTSDRDISSSSGKYYSRSGSYGSRETGNHRSSRHSPY